ncbi:MAG: hypothetical protein RL095_3838 [Verrucomicrobiota bacterium]|jgi:4-hydroxyproline epimerase
MRVIDSHTGGEPTRLVVEGLPAEVHSAASGLSVKQRLEILETKHDWVRRSLCTEPRGSEVMVGACLVEPLDKSCDVGIIFFNNVGYLGMCGHGTIGLGASLAWLGKVKPGILRIETPVGAVSATIHECGRRVTLENVPSFRLESSIPLEVPELGRTVHGDLAWGGNWFFLVSDHGLQVEPALIPELLKTSLAIQKAIDDSGLKALLELNSGRIDHVELFGAPSSPAIADSRSFVLCPGAQYDRSPCGTGTSAKVACLAAAGKLMPGQIWRQQSVIGSVFEASYKAASAGKITPIITGTAYVNGDLRVICEEADEFKHGI